MIEEALFSLLTGTAGIATLISNRVYPEGDVPEQATKPFVVHSRVSSPKDARTQDQKAYPGYRIQLDCYADTPLAARALGDTIDAALDSYRGTVGSYKIEAIFVEDSRTEFDQETKEKILSLDLLIWAKRVS